MLHHPSFSFPVFPLRSLRLGERLLRLDSGGSCAPRRSGAKDGGTRGDRFLVGRSGELAAPA